MNKLSCRRLAQTVASRRKALKLTQAQLSQASGINRALLSRLESEAYTPSVDQLLALSHVLGFPISDVLEVPEIKKDTVDRPYRIAVAGTGYVGLSLAVLLAQRNEMPTNKGN
jgi:UDPglucose 6-dehydrogenase